MTGPRFPCPRLSEARDFLPLVRAQLAAASARWALGTRVDLLPIVEDGVFGYELVPHLQSGSYLIVGRDKQGRPVLRENAHTSLSPRALRLVTTNGRRLDPDAGLRSRRLEPSPRPGRDLHAVCESALARLSMLFPQRCREGSAFCETAPGFEAALATAHSHLARWDPLIHFAGLPNEAEFGFALADASGEHGELTFAQRNGWTLKWSAPPVVLRRAWSVAGSPLDTHGGPAGQGPALRNRRAGDRRGPAPEGFANPWAGKERRQGHGRRAADQHQP